MERKTLYSLGALVVLGVLAYFTLSTPEKGDRVGEKPRPVAEIKGDKVASIEVNQGGGKEKATLTKKGDKWQVTAPYDKPADGAAVKSMVEGLEKMKWGDITTRKKESHGDLEVSDDKALHVVAKDSGGQVLADLYLGKSAGAGTMVRVAGKDDVYQVSEVSSYNFKREAKDWRDKVIFDHKADEAEKVLLQGGGASVTLTRQAAEKGADGKAKTSIFDAKWAIEKSADATALQPGATTVDDALVNRLVQGIAGLRASDFHDDAKVAELGLAEGDAGVKVVRVTFTGGKTAGLRIGATKGEDVYAQAEGSPQVFSAKKFTMESLAHLPKDIGDKTVVKLKEADLSEVTIQQGTDVLALKKGDKGWKADKVADADDGKVKGVAEAFDNLAGSGFIPAGSKELEGLAKPKATVTLKPKTGAPLVIKIGEAVGDEMPVQVAGKDALWVKKYTVERFLKKPADLAKDKAGAAPPPGMPGMPPGMMMPH